MYILTGRDRGKRGPVMRVFPDNRVIVEGVNLVRSHLHTHIELTATRLEMRRKQFNMRMEVGSGQFPRASEVRETRRVIARIKTIIRERQQGGAE